MHDNIDFNGGLMWKWYYTNYNLSPQQVVKFVVSIAFCYYILDLKKKKKNWYKEGWVLLINYMV